MPFIPNEKALSDQGDRILQNLAKLDALKQTAAQIAADLASMPTAYAAKNAVVESDIAASLASGNDDQVTVGRVTRTWLASVQADTAAATARANAIRDSIKDL